MSHRKKREKLKRDFRRNDREVVHRDHEERADFSEEMGADFAVGSSMLDRKPVDVEGRSYERSAAVESSSGYGMAWVSFFFAAASWFLWPVLLGVTSAVIGIIAFTQGARGLAGAAIAIGLGAALFNLFIAPLY